MGWSKEKRRVNTAVEQKVAFQVPIAAQETTRYIFSLFSSDLSQISITGKTRYYYQTSGLGGFNISP